MNHPPYHLRHNKAVDRFLFIELLSRLDTNISHCISDYTYYGLGGPFLNDFHLLHQTFPDMNMVCVEKLKETHKRQIFNKPHKKIKFHIDLFSDYFSHHNLTGKDIIWLDFTNNKISDFELFQFVLGKIEEYGIIKVTLNASSVITNSMKKTTMGITKEKFKDDFEKILPIDFDEDKDLRPAPFIKLLQKMLRIGAQNILTDPTDLVFQPLSSFSYQDGQPMMTLTGIVLRASKCKDLIGKMKNWKYLNSDWSNPMRINVPTLSARERLLLDQSLPSVGGSVKLLMKKFKFQLGDTKEETEEHFRQYADFYRFYPYFTKVII